MDFLESSPTRVARSDPYSIENITSPCMASAKSAQESRRIFFGSPAVARAAASSPLAAVTANASTRKRQRSPDAIDEFGFIPKRQAIRPVLNSTNASEKSKGTTTTQPERAATPVSNPTPRTQPKQQDKQQEEGASDRRDSGFEAGEPRTEAELRKKDVGVTATVHDDSGFCEPPSSPPGKIEAGHHKIEAMSIAAMVSSPMVQHAAVGSRVVVADMATDNEDAADLAMEVGGSRASSTENEEEPNATITVGADSSEVGTDEEADDSQPSTPTPAPTKQRSRTTTDPKPSGAAAPVPIRKSATGHPIVYSSILDDPATLPQPDAKTTAKAYTISRISAHRAAPDCSGSDADLAPLELLVHWDAPGRDGEPTWEPEDQMHLDCRDAVAEYWDGVEGGRLSARPYEVFAVRGHEWVKRGRGKGAKHNLFLRVEWLGYVEETLEPVGRFSKDQPLLVEKYFEMLGGRPTRS